MNQLDIWARPQGLEASQGVTRRDGGRICGACGAEFEPYARAEGYQAYCSPKCRQAACRERRAQRQPKPTRAERILARLRQGPATGLELLNAGGGTRYGARIEELRLAGWRIRGPQRWTHPKTGEVLEPWPQRGDWPVYRLEE